MGTLFAAVYNCFLTVKITDDMYIELTPEDTVRDLQALLINSIPGFEFPRKNLYDYVIKVEEINEDMVMPEDFIVGTVWGEIPEDNERKPRVIVDRSFFRAELTKEEIDILALLMKQHWVQRQVTSIENTRMKYSGSDFKMSSQANHLSKLLNLLEESRRDSFHMQRLYKRRKFNSDGTYGSNWSSLMENSALDG